MEEQLISFETAKLAKEKGFDIEVPKGYYKHGEINLILWIDSENHNNQEDFKCLAPTQSLLQKWLREEHDIHINIYYDYITYDVTIHSIKLNETIKLISTSTGRTEFTFTVYEEALEQGLKEALKLIK